MRKSIYFDSRKNRDDHGFFDSLPFSEYMSKYRGATVVNSSIANSGKDYVQTYHIEPQGVTLSHEQSEEGQVSVDLFGKRESIGQVEKKILEAARKFRK